MLIVGGESMPRGKVKVKTMRRRRRNKKKNKKKVLLNETQGNISLVATERQQQEDRLLIPTEVLELVKKGDFRKECGPQPFMSVAPVCFIYTADHNKEGRITNPEHQKEYSYHHVGYMAQSVYLVCAAKDMVENRSSFSCF